MGGAAGFAVGGPLGALVGAVAGHAIDRIRDDGDDGNEGPYQQSDARVGGSDSRNERARQTAFAIAVVVLGAKMAKADGQVTPDEIAAFREVFHIPPAEAKQVGRLFNRARRDSSGFEPYARQVAKMFHTSPDVLEELLDGLFHIAKADGVAHPNEIEYLRAVSDIFGFDDARFARIRAGHIGADAQDPYAILGVSRDDDDAHIKSAYRKLVIDNHPDKLVAQGMPQEFVDLATEKLATINAAYDRVSAERGLK